jgi:hypothetical protein
MCETFSESTSAKGFYLKHEIEMGISDRKVAVLRCCELLRERADVIRNLDGNLVGKLLRSDEKILLVSHLRHPYHGNPINHNRSKLSELLHSRYSLHSRNM